MKKSLLWVALAAVPLLISWSCRGKESLPVVPVELNGGRQMQTITEWRVTGPFRLPEKDQTYTEGGLREAFAHDYLAGIGGREAPLSMPPPTTRRLVDFQHDPNDSPDIGPSEVQFMDQVERFPTPAVNTQVLFWRAGEFFKVTYAAAVLASETDAEVALIFGGNSPVKVWLNDSEIVQSPASSVGHDPDVLHLLPARLKRGRNTLLVKMFCFPKRNEFAVRVATRERALAFVREHGGLRDVVEEVIVAPGQPLRLSGNLSFFSPGRPAEARIEVADRGGRTVLSRQFDPGPDAEIQTHDLSPGLYTVKALVGGWEFTENVYIGHREQITSPYEGPCAALSQADGQPLDPCAALKPLQEIAPSQPFAFRLDWQKRALLNVEQLEWELANAAAGRPVPGAQRGTHVYAYRSRVDGQTQYYFLHLPRDYDGRKVPLVVVHPHNTVQKPLLSGPVAFNPDWLRKLATYSDEYGYACLWPHARGRNSNVHLALTDTLEALDDVQSRFAIDADRIYLTGDCGGARNALLFAERFPDRVAAISVLNSATSSGLTANALWREVNSPRSTVENLSNIPLQLIHGDHFPHSPTQQSLDLQRACRRAGFEPELVLLAGDSRWADQDPFRTSFAFFQGKARETPRAVALTTGQLKYGSAHWLRVSELTSPPRLGQVIARFEAPGRISATVTNVSELELLPGRFPPNMGRPGPLEISVNGNLQTVLVKGDRPVKVRVIPEDRRAPLWKTATLEGPVSHAFAEPFVVARAAGEGEPGRTAARGLADQLVEAWRESYYVSCPDKTIEELTPSDIAGMNLVIAGGPEAVESARRLLGPLPLELAPSHVQIGGQRFEGRRLLITAIYPNPLNPRRYVVLVVTNSTGEVGLPAPELARSGSYDAAVWRYDENARGRLLGEWYWDKSWSRLIPAGSISQDADSVEGH